MLLKALSIVLLLSSPVLAGNDIYVSSGTATADTTQTLCSGTKSAFLHSVCMNKFAIGATMTIQNNAGVPVAIITAPATATCLSYDIDISSGMRYTTAQTADWTILYFCY